MRDIVFAVGECSGDLLDGLELDILPVNELQDTVYGLICGKKIIGLGRC